MLAIGFVLALVAVLLIVIATRPAAFRISRGTTISAPADVIFAQIDDLHHWSRWNPFERDDPSIVLTYSGPRSGVGASYHFVGKKAGEGRMTIADSRPNSLVGVRAEFIKPMTATHQIEFALGPTAHGVAVTWAMSGQNSFLAKAFSLFVNMDRMVGSQFEKGLADLKRVAEDEARSRPGAPVAAPTRA